MYPPFTSLYFGATSSNNFCTAVFPVSASTTLCNTAVQKLFDDVAPKYSDVNVDTLVS